MIFKPFLFLSVLVVILRVSNASAYDFSLGIGNLSEHIGKIQTDESGNTNTVNFNPYLKAGFDFNFPSISPNFSISPEVGSCLPKNGGDTNTHHMTFFTLVNGKYVMDSFDFTLGTGFFFSRVWGSGGEENLSNGTGTTSFPLPDRSVVSRNLVLSMGAAYNFYSKYFIELNSYIFNLTSSEDRSFSVGLNVNYHFGEIF